MSTRRNHFDLVVLGAGSAGSACWTAARRLGKSVAVCDGGVLGGECPTFACVPTKALLHCAEVYETVRDAARFGVESGEAAFDYARVKARKDEVVGRTGAALGERPYIEAGVELVRHHARFVAEDAVEAGGRRLTAGRFLIATGSRQQVPLVDGLAEAGYLTFHEAIDLEALPRSVFVLGGGPVGCEFAQLFSSFGSRVYLCDRNERLIHREEPEAGEFLSRHFRERGVEVLLREEVIAVRRTGGSREVLLRGHARPFVVEQVLVATGKAPNLDLDLARAGIALDERGLVLDETLRTTNPRVYAAGDAAGPFRFTHAASYQGALACHNLFSDQKLKVDYRAMPRCVFTSPEVAAVGMTEAQARQQGIRVRTGSRDVAVTDRALTAGAGAGFVKVIADADGTLLGGTIVSPRAGELAGELALAVSLGATAAQVASVVHAFPTFSEALVVACADVNRTGRPR